MSDVYCLSPYLPPLMPPNSGDYTLFGAGDLCMDQLKDYKGREDLIIYLSAIHVCDAHHMSGTVTILSQLHLLNPNRKPIKKVVLLSPLYRWGNQGMERQNGSPGTQVASGTARMQTKAVWIPSSCPLLLHYMVTHSAMLNKWMNNAFKLSSNSKLLKHCSLPFFFAGKN